LPALPGSGPWGSPSSLSAVRPLSHPVATPVTRRLVRSSSLDHLADNTQAARRQGRAPRAERPRHARAEHRVSGASSGTDPAPYPVPSTAFLAASPDPPGSAQSGSAAETHGLAGRRRSCFQDPGRKIIYWRSLSAACQESMACRESIYDRLDTGCDDRTGGYGRMLWPGVLPRGGVHVLRVLSSA
jgi:hypothetical protein